MARSGLNERRLTPTERQRRWRSGRNGTVGTPTVSVSALLAAARAQIISVRTLYYRRAIRRFGLIDWSLALRREHSWSRGIGLAFIGDICRRADADVQAEMLRIIQQDGPQVAKAVWRIVKADAERSCDYRRHEPNAVSEPTAIPRKEPSDFPAEPLDRPEAKTLKASGAGAGARKPAARKSLLGTMRPGDT
jgi:hypothetical protein